MTKELPFCGNYFIFNTCGYFCYFDLLCLEHVTNLNRIILYMLSTLVLWYFLLKILFFELLSLIKQFALLFVQN